MLIINEKTSLKFKVEFSDEDDNPIPSENLTHAVYSLYDSTNKEYVIEETDIKPIIDNETGTAIIEITRQHNTMHSNKDEHRCLRVDYSFNNGDDGNKLFNRYVIVKNGC